MLNVHGYIPKRGGGGEGRGGGGVVCVCVRKNGGGEGGGGSRVGNKIYLKNKYCPFKSHIYSLLYIYV